MGLSGEAALLEISEILQQFERFSTRFAKNAVEAAIARREEITPALLQILDDILERAEERDREGDYMAHLYALFLLAQFRETRAYPLVVRFAKLPGQLLDSLCGDFVAHDLGRVLASVSGGDLSGMQSVIEDEDAYDCARGAAIGGLTTLVASGLTARDELIAYFGELYGKLLRRPSQVWTALVNNCCDLYAEELRAAMEQAFADGLVDTAGVDWKQVERELARDKAEILGRLAYSPYVRLVENTVIEMGSWECFGEPRPERKIVAPPAILTPVKRAFPKTGRNEPCPCGSGKKFKKCCGA